MNRRFPHGRPPRWQKWQLLASALVCLATAPPTIAEKPDILFIICDDLNFEDLGPAHTPNLDKLLAVSTEFKGYPNFPWCNPSRSSLFAGLRPEAIGIYSAIPKPSQVLSNRYWLPMAISEAGYHTVGVGKIPHQGSPGYNVPGWDSFVYPTNTDPSLETATIIPYLEHLEEHDVAYWEDSVRLRDQAYRDVGVSLISGAKSQADPWFVGVGFKKPHGPWYSHRSDWEANGFLNEDGTANLDSIPDLDMDPALPVQRYPPAPKFNPKVSLANAKYFRMGYRACITHIDGLVGDLLNEVDTDLTDPELNLPPNLAVIFTSDHGHGTYNLGARVFSKVNPFEVGNRMPLWVHLPGQTTYQDRTDTIVELVDLYPTLLDLAEHPKAANGTLITHGQSLKPHLLTGDWTGWNNWASTIIVNANQGKRWKRVTTLELTSYDQLWNGYATLFANVDYEWTNPNSGEVSTFSADPEHWYNITQSQVHPLVQQVQALHSPPPIPQNVAVDAGPPNQATVSFFGERGLRYTILCSEDLQSWSPLEVVDGMNEELSRSYDLAPTSRFYRVELWTDPLVDFSFMK